MKTATDTIENRRCLMAQKLAQHRRLPAWWNGRHNGLKSLREVRRINGGFQNCRSNAPIKNQTLTSHVKTTLRADSVAAHDRTLCGRP